MTARVGQGRRAARAALWVLVLCVGGGPADAGAASRWLTLGALAGATRFDPHLADYQWQVDPRAAWGAQAIAGAGRLGVGVRVWQARTHQHIDFADTPDPAVRATSLDLVGRARLLSRWGLGLEACATVGRLRLGYAPDRVVVTPAGGSAIDVTLDPIAAWVGGGGLALRRGVGGPWSAALEVETRTFAMDTAHRSGSTIVMERERFGEWDARVEFARVYGGR